MNFLHRFSQLPTHEQIVYSLMAKLAAIAFVLGVVWVLLGFNDQSSARENPWQASVLPKVEDVAGLYAVVSENSRWFSEVPKQAPVEDPAKALEGKPESMRLTGLVTKGDIRYALFVPVLPSLSASGKPAVQQLKVGDKLVGDWEITGIAANQVDIRQGEEARTLRMYQPKK